MSDEVNSSRPRPTAFEEINEPDRSTNWEDGRRRNTFFCGVVEGFYGRPWTPEQRKDLFVKMNKMGMNSYLYAPKDDCKHRAFWREMYSVDEAEQLTTLIKAAKANNVEFCFSLSPGLDMMYSSAKDLACLKRKLEQVAQLGCTAFALLFDDIEPEMSESDKETFNSFAQAQVSVTNEIYQHLGHPDRFLFCPTEYCSTRAVPSVLGSEYLKTVGSKLLMPIEIMWTGCRVITKDLTVDSINELCTVLRRPPVIWDNLHANDYDQRRVFLGPFSGRSPELIPHLNGLLTNPNCEYETNHVAVHTIAAWSRCRIDGVKMDLPGEAIGSNIISFENKGDSGNFDDSSAEISQTSYHPRAALTAAMHDWLPEFYRHKSNQGHASCMLQKQQLSISDIKLPVGLNTCISASLTTTTTTTTAITTLDVVNSIPSTPIASCKILPFTNSSLLQPTMNPIMNSLMPPETVSPVEPMDCIPSLPISSASTNNDFVEEQNIMQTDGPGNLTIKDIELLIDLFYLPFEHGSQALFILNEFNWLKSNAYVLIQNMSNSSLSCINTSEVLQWQSKAENFNAMTNAVEQLYRRLMVIPNRALSFELYPYVWDMMMTLKLLNSFIKWLGFTHGWKETFMSGDQEPWVFRGGLAAELQRMLPVENINEICAWKAPESPPNTIYSIRPYRDEDKSSVYAICLKSCDDNINNAYPFPGHPELLGDKLVGSFLVPGFTQFCFVLEDDYSKDSVCGYVLAALDAKEFYKRYDANYLPHMQTKYPLIQRDTTGEQPSIYNGRNSVFLPAEEVIADFHNSKFQIPEKVFQEYPSLLQIGISPILSAKDPSLVKKLLSCAMAALKANGSRSVYCEIPVGDKSLAEFYAKIGFIEICRQVGSRQMLQCLGQGAEIVFYGRKF